MVVSVLHFKAESTHFTMQKTLTQITIKCRNMISTE